LWLGGQTFQKHFLEKNEQQASVSTKKQYNFLAHETIKKSWALKHNWQHTTCHFFLIFGANVCL
jgi:hypothetical protein